METTWYIDLHGDYWEKRCHVLLSLKYGADYQPISDKGGDLGLDGMVLCRGIVFQAYGQEPETKDWVKGVKDKIHKDLGKLKTNQNRILEILGEKKIKRWLLLYNKEIPNSSIHGYVKGKEKEVKLWQLEFIDNDFQVVVKNPLYFETESLEYHKKRDLRLEVEISNPKQTSMRRIRKNEHYLDVFNKFRKITQNDEEAEEFALNEIKNYLDKDIWLDELLKQLPEFYSEIQEVRSDVEKEARQGSILEGSFTTFSNTKNTLETRLYRKIGARLGTNTLANVREYFIADWFVRCPLDFIRKE